jgi:uncharacterized protein (DUF58 family)
VKDHELLNGSNRLVAGRVPHRLAFAMGTRLFVLVAAGLAIVPAMFIESKFGWLLLGWNCALLVLFAKELAQLPAPGHLEMERTFLDVFRQLDENEVRLHVRNRAGRSLRLTLQDEIADQLSADREELELGVAPNGEAAVGYRILPKSRGESRFGKVFARYETGLCLAQRWAVFDIEQAVVVLPNLTQSKQREAFLIRSRQIQLRQRVTNLRGQGREFESLREFQVGDEMRNVCWTATARRSNLVTIRRQIERTQTIWTVLDCGRLMRARVGERSKLDHAVETAITMAQIAEYGGDASAMLAYGERIQQRRLPGRGVSHLHSLLLQGAVVREEAAEADHLMAVSSLLMLQKSRALIVWITDLADLAITPEVVSAALLAARRHLVVLAVVGQPDVTSLLAQAPGNSHSAFLYAAAAEMTGRRELTIAQLRRRGVRAIEISAPHLTGAVINEYLDIKAKNLL